MNLEDLQKQARTLWPDATTEQEMIVALGVVYGDMCRYIRDNFEGKAVDDAELKKEMGNTIFSMVRWIEDRGFSLQECLDLSIKAQQRYAPRQIDRKPIKS